MNNYVQLPNRLVYTTKENEQTIRATINNSKLLSTVYAISRLTDFNRNECYISISSILIVCNIRSNCKLQKDIKICLQGLLANGYIESNIKDFTTIKPNDIFIVNQCFFKIDKEGDRIEFFKLYDDDFTKIMLSNNDLRTKLGLLDLYCFHDSTTGNISQAEINEDVYSEGRKFLATWHTNDIINNCIKMTNKTVVKNNKELIKLKLIATKTTSKITRNKVVKSAPIFVIPINRGSLSFCVGQLDKQIERWLFNKLQQGYNIVS